MQKYGRPNEATPAKWQEDYTDFNAPSSINGSTLGLPVTTRSDSDALAVGPLAPAVSGQAAVAEAKLGKGREGKKRKVREVETSEERTERKRRKKEQKERRISKPESDTKERD